MKLVQFAAKYTSYNEDINKYHGKDIVHTGSNLSLNPQLAWKKLNKTTKKKIRRAQRLKDLKIYKAKGTKEDMNKFRAIWFNPKDSSLQEDLKKDEIIYFAELNSEIIGGMILTPSAHNLYLHHLGTNEMGKNNNIAFILLWNAVEDLKDSKFINIDIGVSFRETLQNFFQNWQTSSYPVIFEAPFIRPTINTTPFENKSMNFKANQNKINEIDDTIKTYFNDNFTYFPNETYAIIALLKDLKLNRTSEIAVFKTFQNNSIEKTISTPIESLCNWKPKVTPNTKAILIIHEFGFPHPKTQELQALSKKLKIPLIEDCSWSLTSKINGIEIGKFGDYAIYSLPKIFPMQYGAILKGKKINDKEMWDKFQSFDLYKREITRRYLAHYWPKLKSSQTTRRSNWKYLNKLFENEGFKKFNKLENDISPGGYIIESPYTKGWHKKLIDFNIESYQYFKNCIIIPTHQNLNKPQLDYIFAVIKGGFNLCSTYKRPS